MPIALLIATITFAAQALAFAPHPTVLSTRYKGDMLPVVQVIGTDPVVLVDGRKKRIRSEPSYILQPATGFSSYTAVLANLSVSGTQIVQGVSAGEAAPRAASMGKRYGTNYFKGEITASASLKGAFIVVVIYTPLAFFSDKPPSYGEIVVHELPELHAGRPVEFAFTSGLHDGVPLVEAFMQVFDDTGREMKSNHMEQAWKYYHLRNRRSLTDARTKYLAQFHNLDHAATPVVTPRPVLSEDMASPPSSAIGILEVSPEGEVESVDLEGVDDPQFQDAIRMALQGWLFLPQLKAGVPTATRVKVPLKF